MTNDTDPSRNVDRGITAHTDDYLKGRRKNESLNKSVLQTEAKETISKEQIIKKFEDLGHTVRRTYVDYDGDFVVVLDVADDRDLKNDLKLFKNYAKDVYADDNEVIFYGSRNFITEASRRSRPYRSLDSIDAEMDDRKEKARKRP